MELTPAAQKFVLHWGEMGQAWGINRTMAQVHALYAGKVGPAAVLEAARKAKQLAQGKQVKGQLFYAHLYLGLYYEAAGDATKAKEHMDLAAGEYAQDHYMGEVARVHAKLLEQKPDETEDER